MKVYIQVYISINIDIFSAGFTFAATKTVQQFCLITCWLAIGLHKYMKGIIRILNNNCYIKYPSA